MKAHVGVDSRTKEVYAVLASAANVHDREARPDLLHGNETRVLGDRGHQGQTAVIYERASNAEDFTNRTCCYDGRISEVEKAKNPQQVSGPCHGRARIRRDQAYLWLREVRYRGLAKNLHRLEFTAALANLCIVRRRLLKA